MGYWPIQDYLRTGKIWDSFPQVENYVKGIDSAINRGVLKGDLSVFRGITLTPESPNLLKVGDIIQDKAFVSTSLNPELASVYTNAKFNLEPDKQGYLIKIHLPKGSHYTTTETRNGRKEWEIILARNTKFKVIGESYHTFEDKFLGITRLRQYTLEIV